jgi:hypothetical protein
MVGKKVERGGSPKVDGGEVLRSWLACFLGLLMVSPVFHQIVFK